jgi:2-dehydro-3-deoxyphosphogalactonate aldolase
MPSMKVTSLDTIVVDNVEPFVGGRQWLFVRLTTDEGIVGLGERPTTGSESLAPHIALLEDLTEHFVVGEDPFAIERIWQRIFAFRHDFRHPSMHATPALSAIEMALWDIVGKAVNQPVYNLLGGRCHDRLLAYAYLDHDYVTDPEGIGDAARRLVDAGWTATKIDPFLPVYPYPREWQLRELKRGAELFARIRGAVGFDLEVGIGTHGQFTTAGAIRVASLLEEYLPAWFEEPVPPENVDEMARVAASTSIPIAAGERLATKYEFANLLEKHAAGIVQLDVAQCGGILESKKIAAIAEAHHAVIAPHMYTGPIAAAAAIQLDTCTPNFMIQELNTTTLHREILVEPIVVTDGFITPPTGPGLGVELDEDVLRRQRV